MALKSPVAFHEYWGHIVDATELPNISGATIQDSSLQVGDIVWVSAETVLYQCTTATVGSAVWSKLIDDPSAIHDDVAGEINALAVKGTPTVSDVVLLEDVADSNAKAKSTIQNLPTALDANAIHVDTAAEISPLTEKTAIVDADIALIEDSEASYAKKYIEVVDRPIIAEMSNLWQRPATAHSDDDEFDGASLDASWYAYNATTSAYVSFSSGSVDAYDGSSSSVNLYYDLNPTTRKSWILTQLTGIQTIYLGKTFTFPTNLLVMARLKFNQYYSSMSNTDRRCGLLFAADDTGDPDTADMVGVRLNHSTTGVVRGRFRTAIGGAESVANYTTDVDSQGQALEYVAIHKIGTTYHGWIGTAGGNWIYMGSDTITATMEHVILDFTNFSSSLPGYGVFGVDFIRFLETDDFLF